MSRMRLVVLATLAAAWIGGMHPRPAIAQEPTAGAAAPVPSGQRDTSVVFVLRTRGGSTIIGRIVEQSADSVRFETSGGTLAFARTEIAELRPMRRSEMHDGDYWFPDPNRTRLFFAPTGRMLDAGEGYFSNTDLFVQQIAVGVASHLTLGGGFTLLPTGDMTEQAYYVTPKLSLVQSERTNVAVGALAGWIPVDGGTDFGVLYGVATQGGPDGSVTGGIGWAYGNGRLDNEPVAMLGGGLRVAPRVALISENYFTRLRETTYACASLPPYDCTSQSSRYLASLAMYGVRFLSDRVSVDLALMNFSGRDAHWIFPGIPYVAFAVKF